MAAPASRVCDPFPRTVTCIDAKGTSMLIHTALVRRSSLAPPPTQQHRRRRGEQEREQGKHANLQAPSAPAGTTKRACHISRPPSPAGRWRRGAHDVVPGTCERAVGRALEPGHEPRQPGQYGHESATHCATGTDSPELHPLPAPASRRGRRDA